MSDDDLIMSWRVVLDGIQRTQAQIMAGVEDLGLPAAFFDALYRLIDAPDQRLPMSTLARQLSMTSGGFTKVADRMARAGLIDRRGSSGDRRIVHATLTPLGAELARSATETYRSSVREHVLTVLSPEALRHLAELTNTLSEANDSPPVEVLDGADADISEIEKIVVRDPELPDRRARSDRGDTPAR